MAGLLSGGGVAVPTQGTSNEPGAVPDTGAPRINGPAEEAGASPSPNEVSDRLGDEEGMEQASPEEQAQYDQFVTNGMQVIYDEKEGVRADILARLKESSDPKENLANTTAWLVTMLETSAEKNGAQIDDAVVMHAGKELMEQLADVCQAANIHDFSDKDMEGAWYRGLDLYRETATQDGRVNPDQLKEQFGEIERADQEGRLNQLLPGFDRAQAATQQQGE
jgi:hypothetical protein